MAGRYQVPPNTNEEEKIFGGLLTWPQVIWLGGGVGVGAALFIATFAFLKGFALIFIILGLAVGIPFAFVKKEGLPLITYYLKLKKHDKKKHYLPNKRLPNNK